MKARHAIVVALAAAALVVVVGTASAFGTVRDLVLGTTEGSRIAFTSFRNGNFDLYVMNADGSKQRRLTTPAGGNSPSASAAWSPDGRRIAFQSGRGMCILDGHFVSERNAGSGDVDISIADADGSGLRRVTRGPGVDCAPAWSPDGRKIAFQRSLVRREGDRVVGFDFDIYVINADGTGETALTDNDKWVYWAPYWYKDGKHIIYTAADHSVMGRPNYDLYWMNIETGKKVRLTFAPGADVLPVFSPDMTKLMWTSNRDGRSPTQLYIADFAAPIER